MGNAETLYRRAVAQDILEVAVGSMGLIECGIVRIDDRGVSIDQDIPGAWHSAMEVDEPGSPDARSVDFSYVSACRGRERRQDEEREAQLKQRGTTLTCWTSCW